MMDFRGYGVQYTVCGSNAYGDEGFLAVVWCADVRKCGDVEVHCVRKQREKHEGPAQRMILAMFIASLWWSCCVLHKKHRRSCLTWDAMGATNLCIRHGTPAGAIQCDNRLGRIKKQMT